MLNKKRNKTKKEFQTTFTIEFIQEMKYQALKRGMDANEFIELCINEYLEKEKGASDNDR